MVCGISAFTFEEFLKYFCSSFYWKGCLTAERHVESIHLDKVLITFMPNATKKDARQYVNFICSLHYIYRICVSGIYHDCSTNSNITVWYEQRDLKFFRNYLATNDIWPQHFLKKEPVVVLLVTMRRSKEEHVHKVVWSISWMF